MPAREMRHAWRNKGKFAVDFQNGASEEALRAGVPASESPGGDELIEFMKPVGILIGLQHLIDANEGNPQAVSRAAA
jgi:hypothetical protein